MFRKTEAPSSDPAEVVAALLMPHAGVSDSKVIEWLGEHGAAHVAKLADGFLSVKASRATLNQAEAMARVELKARSKLH